MRQRVLSAASWLSMALLSACGGEPAVPAAARLAARAADPADERLDAALGLVAQGQHEEARALAERVLAEHPGHGRAELLIGLSYHRQKRYALGRPHLERAAERGPTFEKHEVSWYYLGWCRYWLGEPEPARAAFERHLELVPDEGDSHFGLGLLALERGDLREAEQRFRRAAELLRARLEAGDRSLLPEVAKCHARLGDVFLLEERWADARDELQRCVALWPAHHAAWYKLHRAHAELGEPEQAAAALAQHELWSARAGGQDP